MSTERGMRHEQKYNLLDVKAGEREGQRIGLCERQAGGSR